MWRRKRSSTEGGGETDPFSTRSSPSTSVGFVVTNLSRPAERVVAFYNQRGTAERCRSILAAPVTDVADGYRCGGGPIRNRRKMLRDDN